MTRQLRKFLAHRGGNIAITFALLLVPVITAVGMSLDYVRAYNVRTKMQADLDTALLAAVRSVGTLNDAAIEKRVKDWFAAQTDLTDSGYLVDDIDIDTSGQKISAMARVAVPTTLLKIADIKQVDVSVSSTVAGPGESFLNVYIVLDKSASMMLAATSAGQTAMLNTAGCAFACHVSEGSHTYNGKTYSTNYALAKAMGVQLRTDVALDAVKEVLDMIDRYDSSHNRIKVGLYSVGQTATEVLSPTFSTTDARKKLSDNSAGLNSATSAAATYFDYSLTALKKMVGTAGDGRTASAPLKLVLMLTDGVQSERNWVHQTSSGIRFPTAVDSLRKATTPLNPRWCDDVKNLDASFGVLYTEYLPMTYDWGYNVTVGDKMSTSVFASVWGGTIKSAYKSKPRQEYIPVALEECASSSDLFIQADSSSEIEAGLSKLFQQYVAKVRLTN